MKSLVLSTLFNCLSMRGSNPLWPAVGYSGARPPHPHALNLNLPEPAWTCAAPTRSGQPSATRVRALHTLTPALVEHDRV